jgi:hypothetical protein
MSQESNIEKLVGLATLPLSILPSAHWNIGISLHKQATLGKHFGHECIYISAQTSRVGMKCTKAKE